MLILVWRTSGSWTRHCGEMGVSSEKTSPFFLSCDQSPAFVRNFTFCTYTCLQCHKSPTNLLFFTVISLAATWSAKSLEDLLNIKILASSIQKISIASAHNQTQMVASAAHHLTLLLPRCHHHSNMSLKFLQPPVSQSPDMQHGKHMVIQEYM